MIRMFGGNHPRMSTPSKLNAIGPWPRARERSCQTSVGAIHAEQMSVAGRVDAGWKSVQPDNADARWRMPSQNLARRHHHQNRASRFPSPPDRTNPDPK
jgi:hypothetical protein